MSKFAKILLKYSLVRLLQTLVCPYTLFTKYSVSDTSFLGYILCSINFHFLISDKIPITHYCSRLPLTLLLLQNRDNQDIILSFCAFHCIFQNAYWWDSIGMWNSGDLICKEAWPDSSWISVLFLYSRDQIWLSVLLCCCDLGTHLGKRQKVAWRPLSCVLSCITPRISEIKSKALMSTMQ